VSNNLRYQLTETWTYPPVTGKLRGVHELKEPGTYAGRVKAIDLDSTGSRVLTLWWEQTEVTVELRETLFEPENYQTLVEPGDLVSVFVARLNPHIASKLTLLVPARSSGRPLEEASKAAKWSHFVKLVREFFWQNHFVEIQTPYLVVCPGTEPYLKPFSVSVNLGHGKIQKYLPTSPEINLKKYLSGGHAHIFELKSCFRNDEATAQHSPEFLMLEWYRAFADLDEILADLTALLRFLSQKLGRSLHDSGDPSIRITTVRELFRQYVDFELSPQTDSGQLKTLCRQLAIPFSESDTWDELFFRVFIERIENQLPPGPMIVRDYPPKLAAYARMNPEGWADRFEFYWRGLEIANAFHELNDPQIQKNRMDEDNRRKSALGLEPVPLDEAFLDCLYAGLPPSGGIALGMERLFMAFHNLKNISDVRIL